MIFAAVATLGAGLTVLTLLAGIMRLPPGPPIAWAEDIGGKAETDRPSRTAPVPTPVRAHPGADLQIEEFSVHIPRGATEPLTPVVILHGMGDTGPEASQAFQEHAEQERLMIVAPTFNYGDWRDPAQLTRESAAQFPRLAAFLDRLPALTGLAVRPRVVLYGFSRGAQTANRFALVYPERVAAVAMVSAGTYTLPFESIDSDAGPARALFPYGVANLSEVFGRGFDAGAFARVRFWIGVGARDADPGDVPHQWDPYLGDDRVERAHRFADWLTQAGVPVEVRVFPGVGHAETPVIRDAVLDFIVGAPARRGHALQHQPWRL